ncbi:hypothetical protein DAI22_08g034600 [Oryza sativa Japonica Group]|nr:hypothetical protein DAI22_08g034600 [Oryza sativa Japonica Group]
MGGAAGIGERGDGRGAWWKPAAARWRIRRDWGRGGSTGRVRWRRRRVMARSASASAARGAPLLGPCGGARTGEELGALREVVARLRGGGGGGGGGGGTGGGGGPRRG